MPRKQSTNLIQVTFDGQTRQRVVRKAKSRPNVSREVFGYLELLARNMPEVLGVSHNPKLSGHQDQNRFHGDMHEMVFVIRGKGVFGIEDRKCRVKAGDVVLIKPDQIHRRLPGTRMETLSLHFSFRTVGSPRLGRTRSALGGDGFLTFLTSDYPNVDKVTMAKGSRIVEHALRLEEEYSRPGPGSKLLVSLYFVEILVLVARNFLFAGKNSALSRSQSTRRDRIMVRQIKEHLNTHYRSQIDFKELFESYYLHPNYCRNIFKKVVGKPVTRYVLDLRVRQARKLVVESDKPLSVISEEVGFHDHLYFLRAFKRSQGISPGALRKKSGL